MNRLMQMPFLCVLLVLALARTGSAADALYQNDGIVNYPLYLSSPPKIDATNFVNNNSFTINFTTFSLNTSFYETSDTLNYTNNGTMVVNTGYRFDTQSSGTGTRSMADNFNNPGSISCGSINNTGDVFGGLLFFFGGLPQCIVNASNIVNSGTVDIGVDGLMQFTGQNVDLTRSTLISEGGGANAAGTGDFGLNTNFWDPSAFLGPNSAVSAFFYVPPFNVILTNSTSYFDFASPATNLNVIRSIFIQDTSGSNVSHNVYFFAGGLGSGTATIEWIGSYQDVASGNYFSNYVYLTDDYLLGASTNVALINGYPDNFTITESPTRLPTGAPPAAAGFFNVFPVGTITNRYSFGDIQLISTTVSTNTIPNHSITNLPGRIQISAAGRLNLAQANITGPNYMSVQCTNQFDGSAGANIQTPYSDLNLGVTNGFLTLTNLLVPQVPIWSGEIQAWSTRWLAVDANNVTNDFRVLIVGSTLTPTTLAQVQDMFLHGTNSIVISDSLNITRTLSADAQSLTLTTNGPGVGATSLDGELNLSSSSIFWPGSLPNLRNLTNNGAIRTVNQANFGSPLVISAIPTTPAVAASATLSQSGSSNVANNDQVTVGAKQYTFVTTLNNLTSNQVKLGGTFDGSMSNLIAAINHGSGAGTNYSSTITPNAQVTAGLLASHAFTVTAITNGAGGNAIATATTSTHLTWSPGGTLAGGVNSVVGSTNVITFPYDTFINNGLVSDQGSIIYASDFMSCGTITNGNGSFTLQSQMTVLTNGFLSAGGDISITADSTVVSNLVLQAGRSLTLQATNLLTDTGVTNGNNWSVGSAASAGYGLSLPIKPVAGDLLGTTITNVAWTNKTIVNTWAGQDLGVSAAGYSNNAAIGRLIIDSLGPLPPTAFDGQVKFIGPDASNAVYVDYLEFDNQATNRNANGDPVALTNSSNFVIYFAQAVMNGVSVAEKLDHKNNDHLRWVPSYAGYFSSTNLVYAGTTNVINAALAASADIDSDGDGIINAFDPSPVFVSGLVNFAATLTNVPPLQVRLTWDSIPSATNYVFYRTNMTSSAWLLLTNFVSPSAVPPVGGWPITNTVLDSVNGNPPRFYQVRVDPQN